ncbi:hypothetical protein [Mycobacterium sp. HNNTM2301]|uniref:hypothetical protein n=1 Tax=Mycobacterium hainanense TaxID=3289775 RepID=UPI0035A6D60D
MIGAVMWVLYPMFIYRMGWLLAAVSVMALCVAATAAAVYFQRAVRRRYVQALGGLDQPGALGALEALRTGTVPDDPDVLAAAIRVGTLAQAYRRQTTRRQRVGQWLVPAVLITWGAVNLFRLPVVFGGFLIAVGLWWVFGLLAIARRRRTTDENMLALRAAAPDPAQADDIDAASLPRARTGRTSATLAVLVIAFMSLVWLVGYSQPQCNTVGAMMDLVYDQRALADPQNMTRGEPDLAAYRAWSAQLHRYAEQVSDPKLAPGLRRIADLSDQAVTQFAQSRDNLVGARPDYSLADQQRAFSATMSALFAEEKAVGALCFTHH